MLVNSEIRRHQHYALCLSVAALTGVCSHSGLPTDPPTV